MGTNERLHKFVLCSLVLGVAAMLTGCGGSTDKQDRRKPPAVPTAGHESGKDHADAGAAGQADVAAGLAALSDADRAIAERQKVCPVSGDRLVRWESRSKSP